MNDEQVTDGNKQISFFFSERFVNKKSKIDPEAKETKHLELK
jgi:hypothetical protein